MSALERGDATTAVRERDPPPVALHISFAEFVGLCACLMAMTAMSIDIMLPALPAIGDALGVANQNDRQLIVVLYMAGFSAGQILFGPLSDRFGRKPILMAGLAIFIVGTIGALSASSFEALLCARVVQGFGAASPRIIAIAIIRDLYSGRQMARVMSFAMMVFITIPILAPSAGQALIHIGDWHWTFYALLAMGLLAAVWSSLRLPETARQLVNHEKPPTLWDSFLSTVSEPQTIGYGVAGGFMFGCLLSYVASAQQVFVDVFKTGAAFPIYFGAIASGMALASFVNAALVERLGMRPTSHSALVAFIGVSLVLALAAAIGVASLPVYVLCIGAAFFCFGLIAPNFNAIAMEPQGRNAGMASSVIGALGTAIGALTGGIVGRLFDGSVVPIATGFAGCSLISLAIVMLVEGPTHLFGRNRAV